MASGSMIRDVCADNFDKEFDLMLNHIEDYPYVTMDTEFPGIVMEPVIEENQTLSGFNYAQLRDNVNSLKIIQLGLSFCDENGRSAPGGPCWQFNFHFDLNHDMYAADAISLLQTAGLDFDKHRDKGITMSDFGERVMSSGLVLNDNVRWISFHGLYDFGYLLKVCTSRGLPDTQEEFFEDLDDFFPKRCDIKYLLRNECRTGLSVLGSQLGCARRGQSHQGGSDALLTSEVFFALNDKMRETAFDDAQSDCGGLFGLTNDERHGYQTYYGVRKRQQAQQAAAAAQMQQQQLYFDSRHHHMQGMPAQQTSPFHTPQRPDQVGMDTRNGMAPGHVSVVPFTPPQNGTWPQQEVYLSEMSQMRYMPQSHPNPQQPQEVLGYSLTGKQVADDRLSMTSGLVH